MKVVFISTMKGYSWGGSEELWFHAALRAVEMGHKVTAVVFENLPVHARLEKLRDKGVDLRLVGENVYKPSPLGKRVLNKVGLKLPEPKPINRFKCIEDVRADVVVLSQGGTTDITCYPDLAEILENVKGKLFIVNHFHAEQGNVREDQRLMLKPLYQKANGNFFVSHRNLDILQRQLAFTIPNTAVVKNPVNVKARQILPCSATRPSFAVVGRLDVAHKGQDILIQALSTDRWKNRNFILNLYGKGADEQYLLDLIKHYQLDNNVFLHGHVNNVDEIWRNNHVSIQPSLSEGLPLTIVEAMLCGRPSLVTDVGDCAYLIDEGVNGWIAPVSSLKALTDALERMWIDQPRWEQMGEMAYTIATEFADPDPGATFLSLIGCATTRLKKHLNHESL